MDFYYFTRRNSSANELLFEPSWEQVRFEKKLNIWWYYYLQNLNLQTWFWKQILQETRFEESLLSVFEITKTLYNQTQAKPQETFEVKLNYSKETFSFNIRSELEWQWFMGFTSKEVVLSVSRKTKESYKYKGSSNKEEVIVLKEIYTFRPMSKR